MNAIMQKFHQWFDFERKPMLFQRTDPVGELVRAAVAAQARAKTDASRTYEARVQMMVDDLFLKMRKADPHA